MGHQPLRAPKDALLDVVAFEELAALLEPATSGSLSFAELYARVSPTTTTCSAGIAVPPTPTNNGSPRGERAPAKIPEISSRLTAATTISIA
jgi:hypothetical protein